MIMRRSVWGFYVMKSQNLNLKSISISNDQNGMKMSTILKIIVCGKVEN